jgi:dipeptidyl aminopeptidase/acylaminoacyl peptidase
LNGKPNIEKLISGNYLYKGPDESEFIVPYSPVKAKNAQMFIVRRMSASESPNLFFTEDFRHLKRLTDIRPEKDVNWLTTDLLTLKTLDGVSTQGILYKPENFDPLKKYPVIIYYYERLSEGLNDFIYPEPCVGPINIPYFVSNQYLVFTPDIHFTIGSPGHSAYSAVVSAAKYLSTMAWVDKHKIGIQGHSRGGYETNFIITHTGMFAAAMSASGMSDYISLYGGIRSNGASRQHAFEQGSQRIGGTLWKSLDSYLANSPIFLAPKVTTPLLMMNNKSDSDVPFEQGVEFFTALRRLGKSVFMLQYDGEDHAVSGNAATDLTVRMKQFFDYYLKDAPPPRWMTEGIPAKWKGIVTGLELDKTGQIP